MADENNTGDEQFTPDGSMEPPERIFSKIEAALAPLLNAAADA